MASRIHYRSYLIKKILIIPWIIALIIETLPHLLISDSHDHSVSSTLPFHVLVLLAFVSMLIWTAFVYYAVLPIVVALKWKNVNSRPPESIIIWNSEVVHFFTDKSTAWRPIADLHALKTSPAMCLLYTRPGLYFAIPNRAFTSIGPREEFIRIFSSRINKKQRRAGATA